MARAYWLVATALLAALALSLALACGDDDDDDDNDTAGDDDANDCEIAACNDCTAALNECPWADYEAMDQACCDGGLESDEYQVCRCAYIFRPDCDAILACLEEGGY